ncbi:MAG TPA: histidine--tRNA ligase [Mesotoga sp.]|jgi:histidyl-tRNA synthetase|nr:histidine--tRNA ligase [Mesotoga sp.]NLX34768.1 histidine--tRNA ligase [Thermotogaceae bacterium]MDD4040751.1 histidine--tRNA ligase [Mesotoga sp.]MDD4478426.1 histidine--tRNA ligase [Mesotoga sp.]MDD5743753.1 histidine--tRNA ligase [Mesotoga sp.]
MINRIKGTQDIAFEDIEYWQYIEQAVRNITFRYAYNEIRTPIFEATELFKRSVGESTDVVQKEMYTFDDKGGRSITLRPEGTASVARAFIENSFINLGSPVKLFYMGPMFRYEKPQAGRLRQFHQFGAEILGSASPMADFEIIELAYEFLKEVKINKTRLFINSIGCPSCRARYREALREYFRDKVDGMCEDCRRRFDSNVLRLLDCKIDREQSENAPNILEYLDEECRKHFEDLKWYLEKARIDYEIDPHLVRGLDYYSRTAFEIRSPSLGSQDQIVGGGRYDGLVEVIGGKSCPAVGFAIGMERIVMLLKAEKVNIPTDRNSEVAILATGREESLRGFEYARRLRKAGISTYVDVMERNMRNQMKHAARIGAKISVIIGDEELEKDLVTVKIMMDGSQYQVDGDYMVDYIIDKLRDI